MSEGEPCTPNDTTHWCADCRQQHPLPQRRQALAQPAGRAGLIYADIPPYIEIEPERFDSIIEELFIDGDFVIQLTAAYNWGDYAYVYYRSFAGTDSAQQRVLSVAKVNAACRHSSCQQHPIREKTGKIREKRSKILELWVLIREN